MRAQGHGSFRRWLAPPPSFLWGGQGFLSRGQIRWTPDLQEPFDGVASVGVRRRVVNPHRGGSIRDRCHFAICEVCLVFT
jgi:hypothetical protein